MIDQQFIVLYCTVLYCDRDFCRPPAIENSYPKFSQNFPPAGHPKRLPLKLSTRMDSTQSVPLRMQSEVEQVPFYNTLNIFWFGTDYFLKIRVVRPSQALSISHQVKSYQYVRNFFFFAPHLCIEVHSFLIREKPGFKADGTMHLSFTHRSQISTACQIKSYLGKLPPGDKVLIFRSLFLSGCGLA